MTENKRFKIYSDFDDWSIIDTTGEYVAEDYLEWMSEKQVCNLLNEQEELIKRLKQIRKEQIETILKQKRKIKELEEENGRMKGAFKRKFDYDIEDVVDEICDEDWG